MDAGGRPPGTPRVDPPDTVGWLDPHDRVQAAAVLAAALADDPGYAHLFPVAARRERELSEVYRMTLADGLRHGRVLATKLGDEITGVLAMYPPGTYPMTLRRWLRQTGRLARIAACTREHSRGIIRFGELTSRGVPADSWYVEAFGVRPDLQRAGRGSVLLRQFLAPLDRLGAPSYLETTNETNVGYYQRRGYTEAHDVVPLTPSGPLIYPMSRPARPAG
ncbi:GNAT family N-acetyltransferase [Cellulomonas dongxiuzhuiae]|uniref:GNAT family N-acetyltransferase n=1 Tax=Cellulomonas dongxiuzhuiae TaxID=2819979 RepID=A0ABX8GJ72_9CELL|nr:GNAT family N-acetyltransferase [Cellulomonas dongxiuzhuiae]MBO3089289.1 GNAT family N-acetyltransferase [Cellulomonas dongxiuzhuiae]MBO3094926.1 GNAT family N-acetyltransferase [Cellulomonas dongxiuzhuiae]QWC15950.1 GNAT family N-acetyltransferase [Cellulomonas dongxiuzhuiae]